jgi:hypothetical protein
MFVTGNLQAARKVYELSAQTYPRDTRLGNLGFLYSELGNYEKALAEYKEDLKLNPEKGKAYADLAGAYLRLNRLDEARNIDVHEVHLHLYWINFLRHDAAGMERESAGLMGTPGDEDQMLNYESDTALYGGQLTKSRALARRAIDSAHAVDEKEAAALYQAEAAVREAMWAMRISRNSRHNLHLRSPMAEIRKLCRPLRWDWQMIPHTPRDSPTIWEGVSREIRLCNSTICLRSMQPLCFGVAMPAKPSRPNRHNALRARH